MRSAIEKACSTGPNHHHLSISDNLFKEANHSKPLVAGPPGSAVGFLLGITVEVVEDLEDLSPGINKANNKEKVEV